MFPLCVLVCFGSEGCVLVPRSSGTPVATWARLTWVVSWRLEAVFVLLESPCPSRRFFICFHTLPPYGSPYEASRVALPCVLTVWCTAWTNFLYSCHQGAACCSLMVPHLPPCFGETQKSSASSKSLIMAHLMVVNVSSWWRHWWLFSTLSLLYLTTSTQGVACRWGKHTGALVMLMGSTGVVRSILTKSMVASLRHQSIININKRLKQKTHR
jgi:hypothetical protein